MQIKDLNELLYDSIKELEYKLKYFDKEIASKRLFVETCRDLPHSPNVIRINANGEVTEYTRECYDANVKQLEEWEKEYKVCEIHLIEIIITLNSIRGFKY